MLSRTNDEAPFILSPARTFPERGVADKGNVCDVVHLESTDQVRPRIRGVSICAMFYLGRESTGVRCEYENAPDLLQ